VVDGSVLPEPPIEAVRAGLSRDVDVIAGYTRDEWKLFSFMDPQAARLDEAGLRARIEARAPACTDALLEAYRSLLGPSAKPFEVFCAFERDHVFGIPAVRLAEAQRRWRERSYLYVFTWEAKLLGGVLGACHGIDVPFVMGSIGSPGGDLFAGSGPEALALQQRVMDAWLGFAAEGRPRAEGLPEWTAYDGERRLAMQLGPSCALARTPHDALLRAWDGVL
jgi:para-nitrobenzyl esterase